MTEPGHLCDPHPCDSLHLWSYEGWHNDTYWAWQCACGTTEDDLEFPNLNAAITAASRHYKPKQPSSTDTDRATAP